jgi:REP element-mobilizing transposase RayT
MHRSAVARPIRICAPGALYHVTARGVRKQPIVLDDDDRLTWLALLDRTVDRFDLLLHTYCLMDNHHHLVVETPRANLPATMRQLNGTYAQFFNARYGLSGHVFEGRYRSILVEKDEYLVGVCRYVVLNPVRAGICLLPEEYRWSSYRATIGLEPVPPFLTVADVLGRFARTRKKAQAAFRRFVEEGLDDPEIVGERVGGSAFLRDRFGIDEPLPEIPRVQIQPERTPLWVLFGRSPRPVADAYRLDGYTLREIAEYLGCHYSTVSRRLRREEAGLA